MPLFNYSTFNYFPGKSNKTVCYACNDVEAEWQTAFGKYNSMDCNTAGDPIVCGPGEVSERNNIHKID